MLQRLEDLSLPLKGMRALNHSTDWRYEQVFCEVALILKLMFLGLVKGRG